MDCQECEQRAATLHFTQLINGKKSDSHICDVCASHLGYVLNTEDGYSLDNLLAGLLNFESNQLKSNQEPNFKQETELHCPRCDLKLTDFQRVGKVGCAECYQTFARKIDPILRRVHGGHTKHKGKIPKREGVHLHIRRQIKDYQAELKKLIEREEFEEAAIVRDKIKAIKSKDRSQRAGDWNDA